MARAARASVSRQLSRGATRADGAEEECLPDCVKTDRAADRNQLSVQWTSEVFNGGSHKIPTTKRFQGP
ncbi:hypothetical protein DPEC_G00235970 [Dallia pectoralis]|uniref:Uncharacterized protein n=1 Tax=Dallia pectoralis TaxID=75939 RepID=A0ACC2FYM5_DALPE|nr:hypothetical protein DPEC_G00235970 [Dallia pectoralis]